MSFRWFIYFCSVCGGCAAYLGWLLGRIPVTQHHVWQQAIKGMLLGASLAICLTCVDVLWHGSRRQGAESFWRIVVGGLVGALGGFVGGLIGQLLYAATDRSALLLVGWVFTGLLIGAAPGMFEFLSRLANNEEARGPRRKVLNGVLGGAVGGLVGGGFFLLLRGAWSYALGARSEEFWSPAAIGFVVLGLCIGLFIGLAQVILKEAWVTVIAGFRSGREWMLSKPEHLLGRAEGCDIPLFGDSKADKQHARIVRAGDRYYIEDLDSAAGTRVNGERITRRTPLSAGDLIEIGRSALRFGERHRRVEA